MCIAGSVYLYYRSVSGVWSFEAKLHAFDAQTSSAFGSAVSIFVDRLIVGCYLDTIESATYAGELTLLGPCGPSLFVCLCD